MQAAPSARFVCISLMLAFGALLLPGSAWGQEDPSSAASLEAQALRDVRGERRALQKEGPLAKIGYDLALLYRRYQQAQAKSQPRAKRARRAMQKSRLPTDGDAVTVDLIAQQGEGAKLLERLEDIGLESGSRAGRLVSGRLPIEALPEVAELGALHSARPSQAVISAGKVTTEGDSAMASRGLRRQTGADGDGTTVGVLSDSYGADSAGAELNIETGDLPPRSRIDILEDLANGTDEGRAMMHLIRDVAPGADLAFHTAFGGRANFAEGIRELQSEAGAEVIVDDVRYLRSPFYQDGIISQAVEDVVSDGATYFSSAGNYARQSWGGVFQASDSTGPGGGVLHDFGGGDVGQQIEVPAESEVTLTFQWADPYASAGGKGADTDLDLYVVSQQGSVVARSISKNVGGDPVELLTIRNETDSNLLELQIERAEGPSPGRMRYIWGFFGGSLTPEEHANAGPTVFGQANSSVGMGVAATNYRRTPSFSFREVPPVEEFSSRGGIPILFSDDGTRFDSAQLRPVPDVTGPDGTRTTVVGFTTFFGTSAAAPHVAAVAALIQEKNPGLPPEDVYRPIEQTALDMDAPSTDGFDEGFDRRTGFGFVRADEAYREVEGNVPPDFPAKPVAEVSDSVVRLSWQEGTERDLAGYDVYRAGEPFSDSTAAVRVNETLLEPSTTVLADSGLSNGQTYYYRVSAIDSAGARSELSGQARNTPDDRPPVVENFSGEAKGEDIRLEWSPVSAPDLRSYRIYRDTVRIDSAASPFRAVPTDSTDLGTTSYLAREVEVGQTYYYRVTAVDSAGVESRFSSGEVIRPVPFVASLPDTSAAVGDSISIPIRANDIDDRGITAYQLTLPYPPSVLDIEGVSVTGTATPSRPTVNITESQVQVAYSGASPLEESGPLLKLDATVAGRGERTLSFSELEVFGADGEALSSTEESGAIKAGDFTPPSAPANPAAAKADGEASGVDLSWSASSSSDVSGYRIYRDTVPIDSASEPSSYTPLDSTSTGDTTYTDTQTPDTSYYYYRITAVDGASNESGFSSGVQATAEPPSASQVRSVDSDGSFDFGSTGVRLRFSGVSGSGELTVRKFNSPPDGTSGIEEKNVSDYRFTIGLVGEMQFNTVEVRFRSETVGGLEDPREVMIYTRSRPGTGVFTSIPTEVQNNGTPSDISDDTLSANVTDGFGEFVLASDTNPLAIRLISVAPETVDFGTIAVGDTTTETVTISSNGEAALEGSVQQESLEGPYFLQEGEGDFNLEPGDTLEVEIGYTRGEVSNLDQDTLSVTHTGDSTDSPIEVPLEGSAEATSPTAQLADSASVTISSADLSGTVNPGGDTTDAVFEYRQTDATSFQNLAAEESPLTGTSDQSVSATATGLSPDTEYEVRLVATNDAGADTSALRSFTTEAVGMSITGGGAAGLDRSFEATPGEADQPVGTFRLTADSSGTVLDSLSVTAEATDNTLGVNQVALWASSDDTLETSADAQLATRDVSGQTGFPSEVAFGGLADSVFGEGQYYFVTVSLSADGQGAVTGFLASESALKFDGGKVESVNGNDQTEFADLHLSSDDSLLPVELANFNATATEGSVRLSWQTASETRSAGFEVQRQKEEEEWTQVGYVDSKASGGTTTETQSYNYTAENLPVGTHQFRLKQVDLDGSSTLIDPVTVDIRMQEALKLTAPAPNPAFSSANLSFAVKEQSETTIRLYNTLGQQVATIYEGTPQAGENQTARVDVSSLPSGTYFLRLQSDGQTRTQKLTVVR